MPEPGDDVEESEDDGVGLYWVALYLVDLVCGGAEEGGWWYQAGTLVVSPEPTIRSAARQQPLSNGATQ